MRVRPGKSFLVLFGYKENKYFFSSFGGKRNKTIWPAPQGRAKLNLFFITTAGL